MTAGSGKEFDKEVEEMLKHVVNFYESYLFNAIRKCGIEFEMPPKFLHFKCLEAHIVVRLSCSEEMRAHEILETIIKRLPANELADLKIKRLADDYAEVWVGGTEVIVNKHIVQGRALDGDMYRTFTMAVKLRKMLPIEKIEVDMRIATQLTLELRWDE